MTRLAYLGPNDRYVDVKEESSCLRYDSGGNVDPVYGRMRRFDKDTAVEPRRWFDLDLSSDDMVAEPQESLNGLLWYRLRRFFERHRTRHFRIIVAAPSFYTPDKRLRFERIFEHAIQRVIEGVNLADGPVNRCWEIVDEAHSAALRYWWKRSTLADGRRLVVLDLGGGTFRASLLEAKLRDRCLDIVTLGTSNELTLGGGDWDRTLAQMWATKQESPMDIDLGTPYAWRVFTKHFERAREEITEEERSIFGSALDLTAYGDRFDRWRRTRIDYDEYESACEDLLDRLRRATDRAADKFHDASGGELAHYDVLLTGGAARMRMVRRVVRPFFPNARKADPDIVAEGAAMWTALNEGQVLARPGFEVEKVGSSAADVTAVNSEAAATDEYFANQGRKPDDGIPVGIKHSTDRHSGTEAGAPGYGGLPETHHGIRRERDVRRTSTHGESPHLGPPKLRAPAKKEDDARKRDEAPKKKEPAEQGIPEIRKTKQPPEADPPAKEEMKSSKLGIPTLVRAEPVETAPPSPEITIQDMMNNLTRYRMAMANKLASETAAEHRKEFDTKIGELELSADALLETLTQFTERLAAERRKSLLRQIIEVLGETERDGDCGPSGFIDRLTDLLQAHEVVRIPVKEDDVFDPDLHCAIDKETTADPSRDLTVCRVRGSAWRFADDDQPFEFANVVVYRHDPKDLPSRSKG